MSTIAEFNREHSNKAIVSATAYFVAKGNFLPRIQPGKMFRWDYDYVEVGEAKDGYAYGLTDLDEELLPASAESDDWTIGSSSSIASSSRSPSMGGRSPVDEGSMWDGDTLASTSDHESYKDKDTKQ